MSASARAAVWVLLGPHRGDNNQVLALAERLGLPFRAIQLRYKWFAHLPAVCRSTTIAQLEPAIRRQIAPPWPSLVLGIGQRSVPVARYIQRASGGLSKVVRLGDPMVSHRLFDLVITTTQYAVRDAENVIRLPITITNQAEIQPEQKEQAWLERFAAPRRLIVIGGKTSLWRFDPDVVTDAVAKLQRQTELHGGSVIAVTSPRTSPIFIEAARALLGDGAVVSAQFPRYGALLHAADEIHVTADSVSMLSDAISSGKPVGLIPLEPSRVLKFVRWAGEIRGQPFRIRELDKFWDDLASRGLVGTVDEPRSGSLDLSSILAAVDAVRALAQSSVPLLTPSQRGSSPSPKPEAVTL
jgi:mitochondrial fission protein ELM1